MNTVPHSETPITTRQSAIVNPTADQAAAAGASARASMGRRELLQHVGTFGLGAVSFGVLGLGLTGCTPSNTPSGSASGSASASPSSTPSASSAGTPSASGSATGTPSPTAAASKTASATATSSNPIPEARAWTGPQTGLPGEGKYIAWTVDDGADPEVVRAYAEFSRRTGTRLTFFINGQYPAFRQHRDLLLPLVKSGQLQIANHTYSHAALTSLTDEQIVQELTRNDEEIMRLFGCLRSRISARRTGIMMRACWRLRRRVVLRARFCGTGRWRIRLIFLRLRCMPMRRSMRWLNIL